MKKLVLFAAVVFGLSTMNAQKNSILLGGNVGYNHTENKVGGNTEKLDAYSWSPVLGYQFADHWTIGAAVVFEKADLGSSGAAVYGWQDGDVKNQKIGGFIRYSQPFNDIFAIYADLGAGWQQQEEKGYDATGANYKNKADGFYIGFTPALFINFKNNFGLNFSIGGVEYNHMKQSNVTPSQKEDNVKVTFGNAFNIGISKNFKL